jgi:hypothetical protein
VNGCSIEIMKLIKLITEAYVVSEKIEALKRRERGGGVKNNKIS